MRKFQHWLEPKTPAELEQMAQEARRLTQAHFGKTVRLYAPLYLSNECVNVCQYCGFSREHTIRRLTLTSEQVETEARHLVKEGFRSILLVAGEHPKWISENYLAECLARIRPLAPSLALEVGPMDTDGYRMMVKAGAEALTIYQETYNTKRYAELHPAGPKKDFDWRLECPERAAEAGMRRIGVGALFGLSDWREEALALAAHTEYLLKTCWRTFLTVSLPRIRPAAGDFTPPHPISNREMVHLICALRLAFPQIGIVLSTRESAQFRDALLPLGITHMSAGSNTEPGGYTGINSGEQTTGGAPEKNQPETGEQFHIADERPAAAFAEQLKKLGYDPVWKDWDQGLNAMP